MATALDKISLAKGAASALAQATTAQKNAALENIASLLPARATEIIAANQLDLARGIENDMTESLQDRLRLDESRIQAIADATRKIVGLADPIGDVVRGMSLPNALKLTQIRVPLGVIGVIYEARPNVTIDIAVLAIKSGNAVVLRGGSAAGDHMVLLASEGERIELWHRAENRSIFARGALRGAQWLAGRKPGRYVMTDVLGI